MIALGLTMGMIGLARIVRGALRRHRARWWSEVLHAESAAYRRPQLFHNGTLDARRFETSTILQGGRI